MRIIPAIDIINGQCVRLTQGDYDQKKVYNENPLEVAKMYEDAGIKYLHLVDLDGAKSGHIVNHEVLESITSETSLIVDFGGGVKSDEDIKIALNAGAAQVTCGSIAVKNPVKVLEWGDEFGADKIIIGADVKERKIAVQGWTESTTLSVEDLLHKYLSDGFEYVICTDIATDGMLQGPNIELYRELLETFPVIKLIASGGVSSMGDIEKLDQLGIEGVIIGKAIYENKISLKELEQYNA
ncbi:1-(5-phosphoribosyl)-5-[(5-phosphoribosylamino)methylideneamino]imidazole-4-carboxamide isomerase [Fulvivirga sp. RKSG066]|uniref:1-(5-phosphoribosyl)-5-[(5- phosphoribosylamino)methylideneamino]imidazole-4- carboxamide isomerase n=1 Tax=Fulvivirga aurantia TaxID=2529383 RepID=UPI0012BD2E26|nr:1-(5-phosphoribosyl)-5-[(5-phosphoribosylamino)methylideneamino]imidazole-4-carboxamide isomerase [Fulvivirga aurantia]MTI20299.1 1-(5-phosphoribosyl)-5-[(5-phosphoribosylamino)methylideneamino]imidazole-4-carboxamide isomerase [Fulvivirga aurantia]